MIDLGRLDEAAELAGCPYRDQNDHVWARDAARAYRDLLANGKRVEWCETHESRVRVGPGGRPGDERCERAELHLAFQPSVGVRTCRIASKLLVDHPTEEE